MSYQPDETAIRHRVASRIRGRLFFFLHLIMGLPILAWSMSTPYYDHGAKFVAFLWIFTFFVHCCKRLYDWLVERGVREEMEREKYLYRDSEKPKNDIYVPTRLRLADDGELVDALDDDVQQATPKAKQ